MFVRFQFRQLGRIINRFLSDVDILVEFEPGGRLGLSACPAWR